jgi:KaiC/GvpD/RAD55 family RecA-like ATPase
MGSNKVKRIKTHIENLDEKLDGGIPQGHVILVLGGTGTMKSSICYSVLYHNAISDDNMSLYLSTKEGKDSIENQMRTIGIDVDSGAGGIMFLDIATMKLTTEISSEAWFQLMKTSITDLKNLSNCKLLVIDSLESLYLIANLMDDSKEIFDFIRWLSSLKMTIFLVSSKSAEVINNGEWDEAHLVDGIINVDMNELPDGSITRRMKILKMRGVNHPQEYLNIGLSKGVFKIV